MPQEDMQLFDRALLRARQARAAPGLREHGFLHARAAEDIRLRLDAVMRDFPMALEFSTFPDRLPPALLDHPHVGELVVAGPDIGGLRATAGLRVACDEEQLPFAPQAFPLAVSILALHAVNDLPGTLVQLRRALKPDGLLLAAAFGGGTLHELREVLTAAEIEVTGGAAPRVAPFADVRDYGALLQRAGFALPVADADNVTVTYRDIVALMHDLRGMGATNILHERSRRPLSRRMLLRAGEIYAERFPAGDGRIAATFEIIHLSGWAPHESQQQPLRPGTARMRLADALDTAERSAGVKADPKGTRN